LSVSPSIKELKASPKLKQIFSTPQKLCYGKKPLHCAKKHSPTNPKSLSLIPISIRAINNSKKKKEKSKGEYHFFRTLSTASKRAEEETERAPVRRTLVTTRNGEHYIYIYILKIPFNLNSSIFIFLYVDLHVLCS
jgi:hypothetical protein